MGGDRRRQRGKYKIGIITVRAATIIVIVIAVMECQVTCFGAVIVVENNHTWGPGICGPGIYASAIIGASDKSHCIARPISGVGAIPAMGIERS